MLFNIVIAVVVVIVLFVAWRYTSVARGAKARDEALLKRLDPLAARFESKSEVTADEVRALAAAPELRHALHQMLVHFGATNLLPAEYLTQQAQAESTLVYWLMHPNELQAAPASIELVERVNRQLSGREVAFYVFRYRMPEGHWAGADWILGLAGPFAADERPYEAAAGAFSRAGDVVGKVTPAELVDWYLGLLKK